MRHLRIVTSGDIAEPITPRPVQFDAEGQLSLALDDEPARRIVVAALDRIHGARLHELMTELHPALVLDLRHSVRFDLPGTSRTLFLDRISRLRSCYMRAPIEWHRIDVRPATTGGALPVRLHHELLEREHGNVMLLVAQPEHGRHMSSILNLELARAKAQGWRIEQAG